jgi:uncharacterized membrane protein YkvA (DUF1232 family)
VGLDAVIVRVVIGLAIALGVLWFALAIAVLVGHPSRGSVREVTRFLPNIVRLMWSLSRDREVPRSVRYRLMIAFAYNVQPINLVPDFIPVIGFADNIVVIGWALRSTVRLAGNDVVVRHWRGSAEDLEVLYRITRLGSPSSRPAEPS